MDDVRLKQAQCTFDALRMAPQPGVIREIVVEPESERAPFHFDVRNRAGLRSFVPGPAADAEKREFMAEGEIRKLAACQSDAVDLLKRVGEECKCNTDSAHLSAL